DARILAIAPEKSSLRRFFNGYNDVAGANLHLFVPLVRLLFIPHFLFRGRYGQGLGILADGEIQNEYRRISALRKRPAKFHPVTGEWKLAQSPHVKDRRLRGHSAVPCLPVCCSPALLRFIHTGHCEIHGCPERGRDGERRDITRVIRTGCTCTFGLPKTVRADAPASHAPGWGSGRRCPPVGGAVV